jgi:hypothetical protein
MTRVLFYLGLSTQLALGHCGPRTIPVRETTHQPDRSFRDESTSRSVTRSYYRGAAGALLVYDITKYAFIIIVRDEGLTVVAVETHS